MINVLAVGKEGKRMREALNFVFFCLGVVLITAVMFVIYV